MMKAFQFDAYGPPEQVLRMREVPRPEPKNDEVLIRIRATAVNDYDWSMVRGKPKVYRLMYGMRKPKYTIPGMELAGVVEQCGSGITKIQCGDRVYGDISDEGFGTMAEYIAVPESAVFKMPDEMTFEEAAAIPHAALLAWQSFEKIGGLKAGQNVLINGAGGGVGTFGLQLAREVGCTVTGVDAAHKLQSMTDQGFDRVIDYQVTDFARANDRYDVILDCKSTRSAFACVKVLKPGGSYITVGGTLSRIGGIALLGSLITRTSSKSASVLALKANVGLDEISARYIAGVIRPLIDGPYDFAEIPRLIQYFGEAKHCGKVIIKV